MINDRSKHLGLPLPHQDNKLSEDVPRLRESLNRLDAHAEVTDRDIKGTREEVHNLARNAEQADQEQVKALAREAEARRESEQAFAATLEADQQHNAQVQSVLYDEIGREAGRRAMGDKLLAELQAEHDASPFVHDALVRRITVGDIAPVIGIAWLETGNHTGLWYNVDAEGQPITPNARYFDYHPVYSGMRQVLIDGQVMVEIPPFWIKTIRPEHGPFAGRLCKIISPGPADGFRPHPAFVGLDGEVLPHIYIGAYSATSEANNMAGSRPGKVPLVNLNFSTMQARCVARNVGGVEGFRMWDYFHYSALCLLFLIEHCTTNSQAILGRGHVDASAATYTDDLRQPRWRGLIGLYGNVWEMVDGIRLAANRGIELWQPGTRDYAAVGRNAPSYDGTNPAYVITCHEGESNGFFLDDFFLPATSSTNIALGTFPDFFYGGHGSAGNVLYVGGHWSGGVGAGLFCANLYNAASIASTHIGCRLAK